MLRHSPHSADGGVDLSIIVTPMLDMAFQLLAFFIMTYHPPAREAMVDGTLLPATTVPSAKKGSGGLHIKVQSVPQKPNQPSAIYMKRPNDPDFHIVAPIASPDDFAVALERLAKALASNQSLKQQPLCLDADRTLAYGYFIAIQDVIRAAEFQAIEFRAARPQH